ncbi:D-alanyl-D-alanine carboxypeptidase family protein [Vreelandella olivaria]|uniref:D-alanyl-D-alanine carboxypeptidase family protein n=1 Tax=Vreelandella olivaria TaxID=390919 RepID=UPI00201F5BBD|nr:D-alanyl-D-alanine carboxypeptidase family protein [Halomonas olivaria]
MTTRGMYARIASLWWLMLSLLMLGAINNAQANPRYAGIVVDLENGEVLYSENADDPRYPASLTKMMTLYLTFEAIENGELTLDQALPVSAQAAAMPATKLWLSAGSTIPVDTAIRALAVRSANDVAVVVAEALGGSEQRFAHLMTAKARELGMNATTFRNASGLPDDQQITTARDMLTLSVRVMQDFPQYYHYFGLQEFTYRGTRHTSHNRLVRDYPGADGLKTGFIRASGFNVATTAMHDGRRMVAVVMGGFSASSRDTHMANLLDRSFGRASLRDQRTWLANTNFSREFMGFAGSSQPLSPPPVQQPAPSRPMMASIETTTRSSATAAAVVEEQLSRSVDQDESHAVSEQDPLRALIERERELASMTQEPRPIGGWGIQVGAFSQASQAEQHAQQAAQRLPNDVGGRVAIDTLEGQTPVFRARVVALDEARARQACLALQAQGMDCMVVNASL